MNRRLNDDLIKEWHPTKKGNLKSQDATYGSEKKFGGYVKKDMNGRL